MQLADELFISDVHWGFEDEGAYGIALKAIESIQPDIIWLGGDMMDMYKVSHWIRDPRRRIHLQDEIDYAYLKLEEIRDLAPNAKIYFKEGNHECFDVLTECLTKDGWKYHQDLTSEDLVGSYNVAKETIEFHKPLNIHRSRFDGMMTTIKARHCDLVITPNHRLLYHNSSGKWTIKPANEMHVGHNRIIFRTSAESQNEEYQGLSDDEIRIAAWTLTDGSLKGSCPIIYQRKSKVHMVIEILDRMGWTYTYTERARAIAAICGTILKKPCEAACELRITGESHKKLRSIVSDKLALPKWVFELSSRQFDLFLSSYIDGDGSRHSSASETSLMVYGQAPLLDDLQRACLMQGYRTSMSEYRPGQLRLNITKNTTCTFDRFGDYIGQQEYHDTVWCVTTPNDTVIVRRNGKISITGNTRLTRYLHSTSPELADLKCLALPKLLNLDSLKIQWVENHERKVINGLHHIHGNEIRGYRADQKFHKMGVSCVYGHLHNFSHANFRHYGTGEIFEVWGNACLSRLDPEFDHHPQWQHGFLYIEYFGPNESNMHFQVQPVKIINYDGDNKAAFIRGQEFIIGKA